MRGVGILGAGLRWSQVKTLLSLWLKMAMSVLAHNLRFIDLNA